MPTNKDLLNKGVSYLVWALPLIFIGPAVIYNAFINKDNNWHYLVLAVGCSMCLGGMFLIFKGIKTMVDALFQNNK